MNSTERAPEPTMEEILASIRRIISDDEANSNHQEATSSDYAGPVAVEDTDDSAADTQMIDDIARVLSSAAPSSAESEEDILDLAEPEELLLEAPADAEMFVTEEVILTEFYTEAEPAAEAYAEAPPSPDFTAAFPPASDSEAAEGFAGDGRGCCRASSPRSRSWSRRPKAPRCSRRTRSRSRCLRRKRPSRRCRRRWKSRARAGAGDPVARRSDHRLGAGHRRVEGRRPCCLRPRGAIRLWRAGGRG